MEKIHSPEIRGRLAQQSSGSCELCSSCGWDVRGVRPTWCSWVLIKILARGGLGSSNRWESGWCSSLVSYIVQMFKHRWDSESSPECIKTPSHTSGVTLKSHWRRALAALLPCYNDRNGCRPFKYQINNKLNFLAVQATLTITCN